MKKLKSRVKIRPGRRPRKPKQSIEDFVVDIEKDRMLEQEQEILHSYADQAEIEQYVLKKYPTIEEHEEEDSFSYWYGQT